MRRYFSRASVVIILLFATATISSAGTIALDVTSNTQVFSTGSFRNVGWQFQVNAPITIDGLGLFDQDPSGLTESHQVGIWTNSGTLLASATVTSGSTFVSSVSGVGDWLFADIAPILLAPGTYLTGGIYATGADLVMGSATITTIPQVSFLSSRASMDASFAPPAAYGLVEPGVFGPNFRVVTPTAVPEPTSMLLLGSGLTTIALRRRRAAK